jgi:predicted transposase YbfD/YdcC
MSAAITSVGTKGHSQRGRGKLRVRRPSEEELAAMLGPLLFIDDPRIERGKRHNLHEMLVVALCAVIAGAEGWVAVEQFGLTHEDWFSDFLALEHGVPSHDTFGRVFAMLDAGQVSAALTSLVEALWEARDGAPPSPKIVAIDGKTLRRSFDRARGRDPLHLLNAFGADVGLVLGQLEVDCKTNEITALPKLFALLDLRGRVVTIDAMGCQSAIAKDLHERRADYVLTLKENQRSTYADVEQRFAYAERKDFGVDYRGEPFMHDTHRTVDGDHGRIETRTVTALDASAWFHERHPDWPSVKSVVRVVSERDLGASVSTQTRYFLSSLPPTNAKLLGSCIRAHWAVENSLHWTLDTAFREDECRVRIDNAAKNLAALRRVALGLLKQERSIKVGVQTKRMRAAWQPDYLLKVLGF